MLEPHVQVVSIDTLTAIEAQICTVSSNILDPAVVTSDVIQFNFEEAASIVNELKQASVLDFLPGHSEVEKVDHIYLLIESAAHGVNSIVKSAVEATKASVSTKGHNIGTSAIVFVKVPVLVRPHLCTSANTNLGFINDEGNALSGC